MMLGFIGENDLKILEYDEDIVVFESANDIEQPFGYERIWGLESMGDNVTVAVHINRLREKIEKIPSEPRYIQTIWGVGYRFKP